MTTDPIRGSINRTVLGLVAISTIVQIGALIALAIGTDALDDGATSRHVFSTVEMALVVGLFVQGVRIVRWCRDSGQSALVVRVARLCLVSLALCGLGDLVNRNYLEQSYQWDDVLEYSYLVTAIWFFFPGYALIIGVNRMVTRSSVSVAYAAGTAAAAGVLGLGIYVGNHDPAMATYSSTMICLYTVMLTILGVSTIWLVRTYGWAASRIVVVGCLLALVADALIGNFWIARDHFPTIEHVNWIPYFASLAMIQQLPFLIADHPTPDAA